MLTITPAAPRMAPAASTLIYATMRKTADYLFDPANAESMLGRLFRATSNRFSYQFTRVATVSGEVTGLVVAYSGRVMQALELPMALILARVSGLGAFASFVRRAIPLAGVKEAEPDEYFISNLAVIPELRGQGIGQALIAAVEQTARAESFRKLSLTVDVENARAQALYLRAGFDLAETITVPALQRRIGYPGFHRMIKRLE